MNKLFKYIAALITFVMVSIPLSNVATAAKSDAVAEGSLETTLERTIDSIEVGPSFKTILDEEKISPEELFKNREIFREKALENLNPEDYHTQGIKLSTLKFTIKMAVKHSNLIPTKIARTYVKTYGNAILKAVNTLNKASKSALKGALVQAGVPSGVASLLADVFLFLPL